MNLVKSGNGGQRRDAGEAQCVVAREGIEVREGAKQSDVSYRKFDIILCGVGGQGILSVAAVIAQGAMAAGLDVRQSEVHGMAQRGGEVQAHLRISSGKIHGDLIGRGRADMILSMEPLEALRHLEFLKQGALVVSAAEPFNNITNYPEEGRVLKALERIGRSWVVETKRLAKEAGHIRSANMVLIGAAAAELPFGGEYLEEAVQRRFSSKGEEVVAMNLRAMELGAIEAGRIQSGLADSSRGKLKKKKQGQAQLVGGES